MGNYVGNTTCNELKSVLYPIEQDIERTKERGEEVFIYMSKYRNRIGVINSLNLSLDRKNYWINRVEWQRYYDFRRVFSY